MILILSCDGDLSADLVIEWLEYYNQEYIRLNSFDLLSDNFEIRLAENKYVIKINNSVFPIDEIKAVWFRKFGFFEDSYYFLKASVIFNREILTHITREFNRVLSILISALSDKRWITNPKFINLNKFEVLRMARECDFFVPDSYIVNNLVQIGKKEEFIVKSIVDPIIAEFGINKCMMYTNLLTDIDKEYMPQRFLPSLVQKKIDKAYEIRVFYLMGKCYSMVIFSQTDNQTKLDFRQYNWDKPNRFLPYNLPLVEEKKIKKLMKRLNLNCGSIDLIKAKDNNYYFLEVNPTGQFGMVDFPCNYGLHKKVAQTLIKLNS